ncbi:MAG: hypothetical protein RSF67_06890 [Clostridia bacterium]
MLINGVEFCFKTAKAWQIVGNFVSVLKIVIPIIIIIFGFVDISKSIIASDSKVTKESVVHLFKRIFAGLLIFFVPSVISFLFSILGGFTDLNADYLKCVDCITSPNKKCDTSYNEGIFPE